MLRVILVDDEPSSRRRLAQMLLETGEAEVVGEAGSVEQALPLIESVKPNALFLDIRMPGGDGFDLLRKLEVIPGVVFVTGYSDRAVEAFDFEAVDYLLKPVRRERLKLAVERLRDREKTAEGASWYGQDRVCFRLPQRLVVARPEAISALQAEGDFTRVFIEGEQPLFICRSLSHYEKILPDPPFHRIDRSLMIHESKVRKVEPDSNHGFALWLEGMSQPISIGPTARKRLSEILPIG